MSELAEMTKAEMGLLNAADQPGADAADYCDGLDKLLQVRASGWRAGWKEKERA